MRLMNIWENYGLRANPFFNQPLDTSPDHPLRPITLFIGRDRESRVALSRIGGGISTVTLVTGSYGVGKTSFIHYLRYQAGQDERLAVVPSQVRITASMGAEHLGAEILRRLVGAAANKLGRRIERTDVFERAQETVQRVDRWSASISVLGVGGGGGVDSADPPHPIHDLAALAHELSTECLRQESTYGVVLHLNNLENYYDESRPSSARTFFRDVRDLFQLDGVHLLLGAGGELYREVIQPVEKVSDIVGSPIGLSPLTLDEVWEVLEVRTRHLAIGDRVSPPVERRTVGWLYDVYAGNLRGIFTLLGQAIERRTTSASTALTWADLMPAAREVAVELTRAAVSSNDLGYVQAIYRQFGSTEFRQTDLAPFVDVKQPTLSRALDRLFRARVVEVSREEPPSRYLRLSGATLVAMGWSPRGGA